MKIRSGSYKKIDGVSVTLKEMSMQMENEDERHRLYALLTCIVTVIFDVFLGTAAFVCAAITDSSAGYAFALDCILDIIAASFVIWRFYGSASTYSDAKEKIACVCLGVLFCLASVGIVTKSVYDLASHHVPAQLFYVFVLAAVGGIMNSVLGCVKYMLGKKMKSQSLVLEAINTSLSAVLAMMLAVSDILYFYHPSAWTLDPITSLVVAAILFGGGIKVLCQRKKSPEATPLLVGVAV
ncbi:transmembrane protein 163a isoform X2 [Parasteatoda tepidariorum]|uniref:transmembrane protein 163a isoform X2 n=1 Tax=Parasteatoda tepidariorum TaxID=114398 RepID=UPI00077F888F|nr:transmembrane protein 163 isoform X2 [Parasteatoda tepidariorum]